MLGLVTVAAGRLRPLSAASIHACRRQTAESSPPRGFLMRPADYVDFSCRVEFDFRRPEAAKLRDHDTVCVV